MKLNTRLLLWFATATTVVTAIFGGANYLRQKQMLERDQALLVQSCLQRLSIVLSKPVYNFDLPQAASIVVSEMSDPRLLSAIVIDPSGKILVGSRREPDGGLLETAEKPAFAPSGESDFFHTEGQEKTALGTLYVYFDSRQMESEGRKIIGAVVLQIVVLNALFFVMLWLLSRYIILRPLSEVLDQLKELSKGNLTAECTLRHNDEIGALVVGINAMTKQMREMLAEIDTSSRLLIAASEKMSLNSHSLAAGAEEMTAQSFTVLSAGQNLSDNMRSIRGEALSMGKSVSEVAATMEQMGGSAINVARNCEHETQIVKDTTEQTENARSVIQNLGDAANKIGGIVELINSIAEQTNLLALNATIEAASAGAAGKGFSVVAAEIKQLAQQTAQATGEISMQIDGIQKDSKISIDHIGKVSVKMQEVQKITASITSAVGKQSATLNEMVATMNFTKLASGNMVEKIRGSAEDSTSVSINIQGLSAAASQVSAGASESQTISNELTKMASKLMELTAKFKLS